jgi:hypothetical protein
MIEVVQRMFEGETALREVEGETALREDDRQSTGTAVERGREEGEAEGGRTERGEMSEVAPTIETETGKILV